MRPKRPEMPNFHTLPVGLVDSQNMSGISRSLLRALCAPLLILSLFIPSTVHGMVLLRVPFTPQAPHANWSQPWQDACEEATIHMIDRYYRDGAIGGSIDPDSAAAEILQIIRIKEGLYGPSLDESTEVIVGVINNYLRWEAYTAHNPTIEMLKGEIDAGRPVIVPASGRELDNPFFRGEGPNYHTVVLVGHDDAEETFITHEPGTSRGRNLRYSYTTIMDAMHDFIPRVTETGPKRAIFTRPEITDLSANLDPDRDGLTKLSEFEEGSIPWLSDSDGDGYPDGIEVQYGHSPIFNLSNHPIGSLIKADDDPDVYLVRDKRTIEKVSGPSFFTRAGRTWSEVIHIKKSVINHLLGLF